MLQRILNDAPTDVATIVFKMKHEMDLSEVLAELIDYDWYIRQIELAFQAHARDGLILVDQYSGGAVGQHVTVLSHFPGEREEVGHSWRTYDHEQTQRLEEWGKRAGDIGWNDDDWSEHYSTWKEDLGNGFIKIRLMIRNLPSLSDFNTIERAPLYSHFPGFLPIEVIIPSYCVVHVVVPLDQAQTAIKYNFEEDIVFTREKVVELALAGTHTERNQIVAEVLEFLIIKPAMLIHSHKMRDSIYCKMEEFMSWINTSDDIKYVRYIRDLIDRMTAVLAMVLQDPLCAK